MSALGLIALAVLIWLAPIYFADRLGHSRFSWVWGLLFGWLAVLCIWLWWRPIERRR